MAGVEQRPRLDLQRDCWRRLRHWRRSVRSTGAGGASGRCPSSRPKREALPAARIQRTGRWGHEAPPRHRRVRHAARPEANGCQPAWRPAVGVPSMPCRRAAGDHRPTVRRPRPARAMSPAATSASGCPLTPKCSGRAGKSPSLAQRCAAAGQGLSEGSPRARRQSQRLHGPPPARAAGLEPAGDAGSPSSPQGGSQPCLPASPAIHEAEPDGLVRRAVGAYLLIAF